MGLSWLCGKEFLMVSKTLVQWRSDSLHVHLEWYSECMMIFIKCGNKARTEGEVRSDWVIGASPAECVLHLQGYANEASFHLLSCEGTPAIAANAANARPKQLDLPASPAYSSHLAPHLWNGAWESYEKAGIQCVFLFVCLPAWLAVCLPVCLFVCFVCLWQVRDFIFFFPPMQQCQAVRFFFLTPAMHFLLCFSRWRECRCRCGCMQMYCL